MQDGTATEAPIVARPIVVEQPADPNLAGKAWGEFRERAQKLGTGSIGWYEIRTANFDDWLKDADTTKNQPAGFLKQEDQGKGVTKWEDNTETREYLTNAQKRAVELAQKGVGEISADLGIPADQITGKTLEEVYAAAEAKGWNVKEGDPKGDETRDYLHNAYEYAKEQQQAVETRVEAQEQAAEFQAAIDAATTAGIIAPEMAGMMLGVIKDKGQIRGQLEKEANDFISSKEPEKVALGLDLQIAGLQYQLVLAHEAIQKAAKKGDNKGISRLSADARGLDARIKDLQNQRATGKVKLADAEVEIQNLKDQPNQVGAFVQKLGIEAKKVDVTVLNGQDQTEVIKVTSSIAGLQDVLSSAIVNSDARKAFVENLRKNSGLPKGNIEQIEEYLGSEVFKKKVEKGGDIAIKTGASVGALMLLMAWLASKEKQGAMR